MTRTGGLGVAAALLLVVVLALGALYAYRSQSPAVPAIPYSAVISEVQDGRVRSVVIEGGRATITLVDGTRQQATAPDNGESLAQVIAERNRADPAHLIDLVFSSGSPPNSGLPLVYLLPPLILIIPLLYIAKSLRRARTPDGYEALSRLADLRDRGVLTEDEFLREKRRFLK